MHIQLNETSAARRLIPWIRRYLLPLGIATALVLVYVAVAHAQDEDITGIINDYYQGPNYFGMILTTFIWTAVYLPIYAGALVITLSYLQVFSGFDTTMYLWIVGLWAGGMAINYFAYAMTHHHHQLLAALIALPLIFGWSLLLGTRTWSDITFPVALRASIVVALVCAPYFGPTWRFVTK